MCKFYKAEILLNSEHIKKWKGESLFGPWKTWWVVEFYFDIFKDC